MTTTITATALTVCYNRAWLLSAADRLDREGDHGLAAEARAEAALPDPAPPVTVAIRCDSCRRVVSARQADKYDALSLDWALCPRCERNT